MGLWPTRPGDSEAFSEDSQSAGGGAAARYPRSGADGDFLSQGGEGVGPVDPSALGSTPTGDGDEVARAAQELSASAKKEKSEEDLEAAAAAESLLASTTGDAASVLGDGSEGDESKDTSGSDDAKAETEAEAEKEPAGD